MDDFAASLLFIAAFERVSGEDGGDESWLMSLDRLSDGLLVMSFRPLVLDPSLPLAVVEVLLDFALRLETEEVTATVGVSLFESLVRRVRDLDARDEV